MAFTSSLARSVMSPMVAIKNTDAVKIQTQMRLKMGKNLKQPASIHNLMVFVEKGIIGKL